MKKITVYVLGTASAIPVDTRAQSSILLETDEQRILFDSGIPLIQSMYAYNCLGPVHKIFISHMHTDHISMLPLNIKQLQLLKKQDLIDVYGPPGFSRTMNKILPAFFVEKSNEYPLFNLSDISDPVKINTDLTVNFIKNPHLNKEKYIVRNKENSDILIDSYSFEILYGNKKIIYSADIDSLDDISCSCQDADIVFCDGSHINAEKSFLSSFCSNYNIKKLAIIHYSRMNFENTETI